METPSRWLSFTNTASDKLARWLCPPPARTAAFSSARSPGVVLRVSSTRVAGFAACTTSTNLLVNVATPDRWHKKFSMVRSAVNTERKEPSTVATTVPGPTALPSGTTQRTASEGSTSAQVRLAQAEPASTPGRRATTATAVRRSPATSAAVRSPSGSRSSASARPTASPTARSGGSTGTPTNAAAVLPARTACPGARAGPAPAIGSACPACPGAPAGPAPAIGSAGPACPGRPAHPTAAPWPEGFGGVALTGPPQQLAAAVSSRSRGRADVATGRRPRDAHDEYGLPGSRGAPRRTPGAPSRPSGGCRARRRRGRTAHCLTPVVWRRPRRRARKPPPTATRRCARPRLLRSWPPAPGPATSPSRQAASPPPPRPHHHQQLRRPHQHQHQHRQHHQHQHRHRHHHHQQH